MLFSTMHHRSLVVRMLQSYFEEVPVEFKENALHFDP
jgi:hypothetical protein